MVEVNLLKCYKLADNKGFHKMINSWMRKTFLLKGIFDIMVLGRVIPDWFTSTKMGSSICIKWDHDVPNANMLYFAVCVVCGSSNKNDNIDVPFAIFASMTGIGRNDPNVDNRNLVIGAFAVVSEREID